MRALVACLFLTSAMAACSEPAPPVAPVPSGQIMPWPVPANESALIHQAGQDDLTTGAPQAVIWQLHLDVYQDGRQVVVPANVGIDWDKGFVAPIHTHLAMGEVDVESPVTRVFTLGQFFTMWGVPLTGATAYVNGAIAPDPAAIVLANRQEIVVAFGTPPASIPSTFLTTPPSLSP